MSSSRRSDRAKPSASKSGGCWPPKNASRPPSRSEAAADLIADLERLVRDHPLRERLVAQLMLALYRAGRQARRLPSASGQAEARRGARARARTTVQALQARILESRSDPRAVVAALHPHRRGGGRGRGHPAVFAAAARRAAGGVAVASPARRRPGGPSSQMIATSQLTGLSLSSGRRDDVVPLRAAPVAIAREGRSLWLADPDGGRSRGWISPPEQSSSGSRSAATRSHRDRRWLHLGGRVAGSERDAHRPAEKA